jgi:stage II sporulation protein D
LVFILLFLLIVMSLPTSAAMPARLTIHLFESHPPSSRLNVEGPFRVIEPSRAVPAGKYYFESGGGVIHLRSALKNHPFRMDAQRFSLTSNHGVALQYSTSKPRRYAGILNIQRDRDNLRVENVVSARDYIMSVVGSESNISFPLESAKAQAVLTQTRVYRTRPGDSIGDSTQQESYFGTDYVTPLVEKAVGSVWGQILTYHNEPIHIFYHSTCAGSTSDAFKVFGEGASNMPYMPCVRCDFCRDSPFWKPTRTRIPLADLTKEFGSVPDINSYDCAKRPTGLTLHQCGRIVDISGYQFWIKLGQRFGWDKAPGTRFKISRKGADAEVESTGAGHGVGMCQWGAAGLAKRGKTYSEILKFYFPGTEVRKL